MHYVCTRAILLGKTLGINYACSNILWSCLAHLLVVIHSIGIKGLDISDFGGIFGRIVFAQMANNIQI